MVLNRRGCPIQGIFTSKEVIVSVLIALLSLASLVIPTIAFPSEDVCLTCHYQADLSATTKTCSVWMRNGHPVYVTPSKDVVIPPEFPLNSKGQIFCGTCHTAGVIDEQATDLRPEEYTKKVFLRQENNNSRICKSCHVQQTVGNSEQGIEVPSPDNANHPVDFIWTKFSPEIRERGGRMGTVKNMIICETCHIVHRSQDEYLLTIDNSNSELCGACHANEYASNREGAERKGTHSVNIMPIQAEISPSVLAQGGKLNQRGKLICLTCHRVHNAPIKQKLLVKANNLSSLCIECHQQQYENIKASKHDLGFTAPREKNIMQQSIKQGGICSPCHLAHNGTGAKMWARPLAGDQTNVISQLCNSCHSPDNCASGKTIGQFSHSVGIEIAETGVLRVEFPLYSPVGQVLSSGQVTCATCHDAHRWDPRSTAKRGITRQEGDETNSFLRKRNTRSALCLTCHMDKGLIQGTEHDPKLALASGGDKVYPISSNQKDKCSPCHAVHNAQAPMLWNRELGPGDDDISRICASCHAPGQIAQAKLVGEHSHPVNVSIDGLGSKNKINLPLFNQQLKRDSRGKIFCNSCHDTHRWDPRVRRKGPGKNVEGDASNSFLRVSAKGVKSNLCYNCHKDKAAILGTKHDISRSAYKDDPPAGEKVAGGICSPCHSVHNAALGIRLWSGKLGVGEDDISQLCNSCHTSDNMPKAKSVGQYSHPVNIKLARSISPLLPTYDEDLKIKPQARILCSTCHDPHRQYPNNKGDQPEGDFLRISNPGGYELCVECHPGKERVKNTEHDLGLSAPGERNSLGQTTAQSGVCGACHLVHQAASALKLWAKPPGEEGEGLNRLCQSCHQSKGCASAKLIGRLSHPVGVGMIGAEGKTSLPLFTPEGQLDKLTGRVYCSTCHNSHQWDAKSEAVGPGVSQEGHQGNSFLRIANSPTASLCQDCHPSALGVENSPHDLSTSSNQGQQIAQGNTCNPCHLVHNSRQELMLWAREPGPQVIKNWDNKLAASQNQSLSLCTSCHSPGQIGKAKQPAYALHPGGMFIIQKQVAPTVAQGKSGFNYRFGPLRIKLTASSLNRGLMPRFPLFALDGKLSLEGDITCPTCHDPHRWRQTDRASPNNSPSLTSGFLRPGVATDFCSDCHAYDAIYRFGYYHRLRRGEGSPKIISKSNPHKSGTQTKPCENCHKPGGASTEIHPVGNEIKQKQGISIPADLPLNTNRITCNTCHNLQDQRRMRDQNPNFLRSYNAEPLQTFSWTGQKSPLYSQNRYVLCFQCHQQERYSQFSPHRNQIDRWGEINHEVCLLCHYEVPDRGITSLKQIKLKGRLDQQCIGCHPGRIEGHPMKNTHYGKSVSASLLTKLNYFTKRAKVFIPLANNRISCPTCHNSHQQGVLQHEATQKGAGEKGMLRLVGYEACAICHRKDYNIPQTGSPW